MATGAEPHAAAAPVGLPERYRPLRLIAIGGSASVWCADDLKVGARVAIKILAPGHAHSRSEVRRFQREARAAALLSGHPHIATIFDVGHTAAESRRDGLSLPFIVMKHLPGGTVADAMRVGAVSLDDAVRWLFEAADALDYAHAKGVVHRDVKPANLLLDRRRRLHVGDFGIAEIGREPTLGHVSHVLGTASYLAPERALGRPATIASDDYSLAVVAFELLTGQRPFSATSQVAQARQHLELEPPAATERNPSLPRAVDAVLMRGMAKAPADRYPSACAFAEAIERALAPAPLPLYQRPEPVPQERGAVRRRFRSIATVAAATLTAVGLTLVWAPAGNDASNVPSPPAAQR